jgi:hypothetical protein
MTAKELQEKCMTLQRECNDKQSELRKQYAIEHNPVKVGDIVTDHYHAIRVEKMSIYGHPIPFMRYQGTELTKYHEFITNLHGLSRNYETETD